MSILENIGRFLGYKGPRQLPSDGDRRARNRQVAIPTYSQSEWLLSDLQEAISSADTGALRSAAKLANGCRRDGTIAGLLSTRTRGMLSLPLHITGDQQAAADLREDFAKVLPVSELALLLEDGILLSVGIGEFVQKPWERLPTLRRLDPEHLQYMWSEDAWYYQTANGRELITPGDGRWILHLPGGHVAPWKAGLWQALGRAYISKLSAFYLRENYSQRLANAARVATTPTGVTHEQRGELLQETIEWGINSCFILPQGYDLKILETNGRGHEVFGDIMKAADLDAVIALSGQTVTLDGGAGFQNGSIFQAIRNDLIQFDAIGLAETLMNQALPMWAWERGISAVGSALKVIWDTTPPKDRNLEATASMQAASSAKLWIEMGAPVDVVELARRYGMPLLPAPIVQTIALPEPEPVNLLPEVIDVDLWEDTAADDLAAAMTEHGIERCEHGSINRCPRCGIERVRGFDVLEDGSTSWKVQWRAIPSSSD